MGGRLSHLIVRRALRFGEGGAWKGTGSHKPVLYQRDYVLKGLYKQKM